MIGNFRRLDARSTDLLPPRYIGPAEGVRTETREITSFGGGGSLQSLAHAESHSGRPLPSVRAKTHFSGCAFSAVAFMR
jgi:hypothetical protein